jgi:hypothetical protein
MIDLSGFTWFIIAWTFVALVIAGVQILKPVNRSGLGFFLVLLFGPLGLVIAWVVRENNLLEQRDRQRNATTASSPATAVVPDPHPPALVSLGDPPRKRTSQEDAESELARFDMLRQQGIVSQAEFDQKRRGLLGLGG